MELAVDLFLLGRGLAALAYDSDIADALNAFPYRISELNRQRHIRWVRSTDSVITQGIWDLSAVHPSLGNFHDRRWIPGDLHRTFGVATPESALMNWNACLVVRQAL